MRNLNETHLPDDERTNGQESPGLTRLPDGVSATAQSLAPGDRLAGGCVVQEPLSGTGRQAEIYLASKDGQPCVIKYYPEGRHVSEKLQAFLKSNKHPNLARIIASGDHLGRYFEIYDYFAEGTLQQQRQLDPDLIRTAVVPSINEGLRELHQQGIIHCDIKPGNLFFAQNRTVVVIGDFGVSGYIGSEGKLVVQMRGTPEYAPRIKSHFGYAALSPAYDYGSFGLVLYRMATGYSLFESMSEQAIASAWERGIVLPKQLEQNLREIILGLIEDDEDQRWGYREVKHWSEGYFIRKTVQPDGFRRRRGEKPVRPLIFGRFSGQTVAVATLEQLAGAIRNHWEHTGRLFKRRELFDFLEQFDHSLAEKAQQFATLPDPDEAAFKLLYAIWKSDQISYRGKNYGHLGNLLDLLARENDPDAVRFVVSGLLIYFLRLFYKDSTQLDELESVIQKQGLNDLAAIRTLCYSLREQKNLIMENRIIETLDDFVDYIAGKTTAQIAELADNSDIVAWLYYQTGFSQDVVQMMALQEEKS